MFPLYNPRVRYSGKERCHTGTIIFSLRGLNIERKINAGKVWHCNAIFSNMPLFLVLKIRMKSLISLNLESCGLHLKSTSNYFLEAEHTFFHFFLQYEHSKIDLFLSFLALAAQLNIHIIPNCIYKGECGV